jgi:hypothetical protein
MKEKKGEKIEQPNKLMMSSLEKKDIKQMLKDF